MGRPRTSRVGLIEDPRPFAPDLTPLDMLRFGVFGGAYFDSGDYEEFPPHWRDQARAVRVDYDITANLFGVMSGLSMEHWIRKGWIRPSDPKGWFQWYCRYYLGRRHEDDEWQIKRWRNFARHIGMLKYHSRNDPTRCLVQRQALLHWGYDPFADCPTPRGMTIVEKTEHYVARLVIERTV